METLPFCGDVYDVPQTWWERLWLAYGWRKGWEKGHTVWGPVWVKRYEHECDCGRKFTVEAEYWEHIKTCSYNPVGE
jgi:hypothetical protein